MFSSRSEFLVLARQEGANVSELCRRFQISRKTGYKWLARGSAEELSRRPATSPGKTPPETEALILAAAARHPHWGARKLQRLLLDAGHACPSPSTVGAVLLRHGAARARLAPAPPWQRFERGAPNELWQMDFKGHFALSSGLRCHPLTVVDDHSRFALVVRALPAERTQAVQECLERAFCTYGLPQAVLCDNGPPWGGGFTPLEAWLLRAGVKTLHGRPRHPQTQGKLERFHRTLKQEALEGQSFESLKQCQDAFDRFRDDYNLLRPHGALGLERPVERFCPGKAWDGRLAEPGYPEGWHARRVQAGGEVFFQGRMLKLPKGLRGQDVGICKDQDGQIRARFFDKAVPCKDIEKL